MNHNFCKTAHNPLADCYGSLDHYFEIIYKVAIFLETPLAVGVPCLGTGLSRREYCVGTRSDAVGKFSSQVDGYCPIRVF
jgi:hypothetical protein